jgi:6-phospho-3-hexuloisomerase
MANLSQTIPSETIETDLTQAIELVLREDRKVLEKISYPAIAQLSEAILKARSPLPESIIGTLLLT